MFELNALEKPDTRVLVLATPELATRISNILRKLDHVQVTTPNKHKPENAGEFATITQLTSAIFPMHHAILPRQERQRQLLSFFEWGYYDYVILQDLWLSEAGAPESLEAAGLVLASLDFMRGNFGTKKIVLLSDASFAWWKAVRLRDAAEDDGAGSARERRATKIPDERQAQEELIHRFDAKGAWSFVHLTEDAASARRLCELVLGSGDGRRKAPPSIREEALDDISRLYRPVLKCTDEQLREYIRTHAEIIIVEDDPHDLKRSLQSLRGSDVEVLITPGTVAVARGFESGTTFPADRKKALPDDFEGVVAQCCEVINECRGKENTIVVLDVLLNVPGDWRRTGIDLLKELRQKYRGDQRLAFVVFTGFSTPSIIMSAYQLGADFVVQKTGSESTTSGSRKSAERPSHEPIVSTEVSRLIMTLALICFQKETLRELRRCVGGGTVSAAEAHLLLTSIVPKHSVSLHMHEEWEDTLYLIWCAQTYGCTASEFRWAREEVAHKYSRSRGGER